MAAALFGYTFCGAALGRGVWGLRYIYPGQMARTRGAAYRPVEEMELHSRMAAMS